MDAIEQLITKDGLFGEHTYHKIKFFLSSHLALSFWSTLCSPCVFSLDVE
jgi:hypothetical protein